MRCLRRAWPGCLSRTRDRRGRCTFLCLAGNELLQGDLAHCCVDTQTAETSNYGNGVAVNLLNAKDLIPNENQYIMQNAIYFACIYGTRYVLGP